MNAPKPPDPGKTAEAQFRTNAGTAIVQNMLNQTNQVTPFGTLTYSKTGSTPLIDSNGKNWGNLPQFTATQTSPQLEALINSPFDANAAATARQRDYDSMFLDDMWNRDQQTYESNLLNRGLAMGSEAYNSAMQQFGDQRARAYANMDLSGRNQAYQEVMSERARPINEILSAINGVPFGSTPSASINAPDYAGLVQANYAQRMANHNAKIGAVAQLVGSVARAGMGGWGG